MKSPSKYYKIAGFLILPVIWLIVKYLFKVEDRYLPTPISVINASKEIEPNILIHILYTTLRLWIGFTLGLSTGIILGLLLYNSEKIFLLLNGSFQSLRSVPAAAIIPFFLLWFGFSETGRFLIIIVGISFNLAISTYQILTTIPERYKIFFEGIKTSSKKHIFSFCLPYVLEKILPTVRFSLSTAIGLIVVSEILGSQVGLGYLIQTARSTFSMNIIILVTIIFGLINYFTDLLILKIWKRMIFWQTND